MNNPNTPQQPAPKKSFWRKTVDRLLREDEKTEEMKEVLRQAEAQGGVDLKQIEIERELAIQQKKEEERDMAKRKKEMEKKGVTSSSRDGAKSVLGGIRGKFGKKEKKGTAEDNDQTKVTDLPDVLSAKGLDPLLTILSEAEKSDNENDKNLVQNVFAIIGIIGLLRNHELMDSKFDQEAIIDAEQGDKDKYESIVTHRGFDVEHLFTLLRAVLTAISGVEISRNEVINWVENEKLLALNIIYNNALDCDGETSEKIVRKKLSGINPAMSIDVSAWQELFKMQKALKYWKEHPEANSSEVVKHNGIKRGVPGEHKIGLNLIRKVFGQENATEQAPAQAQPNVQAQTAPALEPTAENSVIAMVNRVEENAEGALASDILLLKKFVAQFNDEFDKAVFSQPPTNLMSDQEVLDYISNRIEEGDADLDEFDEALSDNTKKISQKEKKILKGILIIIAEFYEIKNDTALASKISTIARGLRNAFPQL